MNAYYKDRTVRKRGLKGKNEVILIISKLYKSIHFQAYLLKIYYNGLKPHLASG
jgi:hypothetical protein